MTIVLYDDKEPDITQDSPDGCLRICATASKDMAMMEFLYFNWDSSRVTGALSVNLTDKLLVSATSTPLAPSTATATSTVRTPSTGTPTALSSLLMMVLGLTVSLMA